MTISDNFTSIPTQINSNFAVSTYLTHLNCLKRFCSINLPHNIHQMLTPIEKLLNLPLKIHIYLHFPFKLYIMCDSHKK